MKDLKIIVSRNFREQGKLVNEHLNTIRGTNENYIIDTAKQLKELGVDKVHLMVTFTFFSKEIEKFNSYYDSGYFEKVYASNLVYVPDEIRKQDWFELVDCLYNIANIINNLNYGRSIGEVIKGRNDVLRKVRKIRRERGK